MDVFVANEQSMPVDEPGLSALARHTLSSEQIDDEAELSILIVDAAHMQRLNAHFANDDFPTDVLAFPMMEEDEEGVLLGDVVICPDVAERNAAKFAHSLNTEMNLLLVHGTLHLLGYDHQASHDKARMDTRVKEVLESFDRPAV